MDSSWSPLWPTEPGMYWFAGWKFGSSTKPGVYLAKAIGMSGKVPIVVDGHFMYKTEGGSGVWKPATVPELPSNIEVHRPRTP